eukprot:3343837-Prorocentrum_lima.AAC.1
MGSPCVERGIGKTTNAFSTQSLAPTPHRLHVFSRNKLPLLQFHGRPASIATQLHPAISWSLNEVINKQWK